MVNIVNLKAICVITNCHSIYYSIILTFNGNYQKIKIFISWCVSILQKNFLENMRTEGYMQAYVIFHRKLPNPEVHVHVYYILSETRNIGLSKKIQCEFARITGTNWLNVGCWPIYHREYLGVLLKRTRISSIS